ncbi:unnamed protein product, partial [Ascophyllum nodosum]
LEREPHLPLENETLQLDMEIQNWPFCTSFGHGGGRECLAEKQDVLLERDGALSDPPTPHTLLIPRCEGDTVATLRFVCDYRL